MPLIKSRKYNKQDFCNSIEHNPPSHLYLEAGEYTWKCPMCGKEKSFVVPMISFRGALSKNIGGDYTSKKTYNDIINCVRQSSHFCTQHCICRKEFIK